MLTPPPPLIAGTSCSHHRHPLWQERHGAAQRAGRQARAPRAAQGPRGPPVAHQAGQRGAARLHGLLRSPPGASGSDPGFMLKVCNPSPPRMSSRVSRRLSRSASRFGGFGHKTPGGPSRLLPVTKHPVAVATFGFRPSGLSPAQCSSPCRLRWGLCSRPAFFSSASGLPRDFSPPLPSDPAALLPPPLS